jgi:2'-5' RNA ligase
MARFGLATVFEDVPDGYEFTDANTPLHLTHVDVCEIDLDPSEFINKLREHLRDTHSFEITPTEDTFFGPEKNIPVTLIAMNTELKAFHAQLMRFLRSQSAVFDNPQFHDDQYSPHISIYGQRRVLLDQPLTIKSISVGNKRTGIENPPNRIIATIPLA